MPVNLTIIKKRFYLCIIAVYIHFKLGAVFFGHSHEWNNEVSVRMISCADVCNVFIVSKLILFIALMIPIMSNTLGGVKITGTLYAIIGVELINTLIRVE